MHHLRPWPVLRALVVVACLLGLLSPAWAQSPRQETLQSNAAATGNGTQASALGYSLAAVQIIGTTFTGTLSFEASVDGTTYTAVMCTSMANTTMTSTTATASGTWFCPMAGAQRFRARLSSYSAGSVTVIATFMPQVSRPTGQNGGAGSAAVGAAGTLQTSNGAAGLDAYAGVTCTNSVLTALDATGQGGCTQVAFGAIAAAAYTTDTTLAADSSSLLTTEHAVKTYVDSVAFTGLSWKGAVVAATTTAGTLASSFENGDTIDGVVLVTGDRLLIKDQAAPAANGVYTVAASGAPTRVTDIDASAEFNGATVLVIGGTVNVSSVWTQTTVSPTVGTDPIVWAAVSSGTAYLAGSGLALTGNTFAVDSSVVRTTRTLTVAGTANEVTSSVGAQDLSANRTWTLSLPTALNLSGKKLQGASPLVFEGLSVDSFATTLAVADPAANRTVTLPNETGTLCTTGSVCSGYQAAVTGSVVTGTGTQNVLPKWASGGTSLADSNLSDSGTLLTAAKPLRLNGATSGGVTLTAADATTAYTFKWPATQATADQCLHNDGLGNGSWSTCSYNTVQDEGSALTQRQILNFVGDGVACVDDGGGTRTTCTITGLAGGGITGSGTTGTIPLWSSSTALGDSLITVSSNAATLGYGLRYKTASKSSNFTFGVSDYTILCTAGSGGITGTLPAASGLTGQKYYLYKVDSAAGACTLAPNGSDTLNGVNASLATLTTPHAGFEVTWESSTGWVVVSLGPLAIGDTVAGGTAASVLTVATGPVLSQVTPGVDGYVFTMVSGVPAWAAASGGSGTVNSGTSGRVAYYATTGTAVSGSSGLTVGASAVRTAVLDNATSGTVTLQTVTGALGTRTISFPAETGTLCTTGSVCSGYQAAGSYLTSMAIGGTVTSGTAGSMLFVGTGPVLAQDNGAAFWDATLKSLALSDVHASGALTFSNSNDGFTGLVVAGETSSAAPAVAIWGSDASGSGTLVLGSIGTGTFASPGNVSGDTTTSKINFEALQGGSARRLATIIAKTDPALTGSFTGDLELIANIVGLTGSDHLSFTTTNEFYRITSTGSTAVDATACTANASTHCLAGQVEVQSGRLLLQSAQSNMSIGDAQTGAALTTNANNNILIGFAAGMLNQDGDSNILIGTYAGSSLVTADQNVMIGRGAGGSATSAGHTMVGYNAGPAVTSGVQNVLVGIAAGATLTTGDRNTLLGPNADAGAANSYSIGLGLGATATASNQMVIGADYASASAGLITALYLGSGVRGNGNNTTLDITVQGTGAQSGATNNNGASLTLASGIATGSGTSNIVLKTPVSNGGSGTTDRSPATRVTVDGIGLRAALAAAEAITAGATITADQCAGTKLLSSASAVTTSTSNSLTAPAAGNANCHMTMCNTNASDAITIDKNANILLTGGADLVLGAGCCIDVVSTGASGVWKQTTAQLCSS